MLMKYPTTASLFTRDQLLGMTKWVRCGKARRGSVRRGLARQGLQSSGLRILASAFSGVEKHRMVGLGIARCG